MPDRTPTWQEVKAWHSEVARRCQTLKIKPAVAWKMLDVAINEVSRRDYLLQRLVAMDPVVNVGYPVTDEYVCITCDGAATGDTKTGAPPEDFPHLPNCLWVVTKQLYDPAYRHATPT